MATIETPQFYNDYCPQLRLTYSVTSNGGGSAVISWTLSYVVYGYAAYTEGAGRDWEVYINNKRVSSGSYNINGVTSTRTLKSGKTTVTKTHVSQSIPIKITFDINLTWGSVHRDTVNANGTQSISAKTKYTVKYDANGGSGAPSTQTKWYGETLTLSTTKPTRAGYTFAGWSTDEESTSVKYSAGGKYTSNSSATLYAVWTNNKTMTISYNANGGTDAPPSQTHTYNTISTLSTSRPQRDGYWFLGWATSSSAGQAQYKIGGIYQNNNFNNGDTVTLYAVWKKMTMVYARVPDGSDVTDVYVNVPEGVTVSNVLYRI